MIFVGSQLSLYVGLHNRNPAKIMASVVNGKLMPQHLLVVGPSRQQGSQFHKCQSLGASIPPTVYLNSL